MVGARRERTYEPNEKGEAKFQAEAAAFTEHGYEPSLQREEGGHIHAGRLLLTGGLSIFAGKRGIRAGGKRTVTWRKQAGEPAASGPPDVMDQLRKLGELRDAGILTAEEFEAKKAELLARM